MNKFNEMTFFVMAVEHGSITEAARRLGTAKSVVSQRIQQLEQRLGTVLLERGRQTRPTASGRLFYDHCVRILDEVSRAENSVQALSSSLQGTFRLAAPMAFSISHLSSLLASFALRYPDMQLDIEFDDRHVNLHEDDFDAAIRIGQLSDSSLIARSVAVNRHLICGSPAYLNEHGTPQIPDDLSAHRAILFNPREPHGMWTLPVNQQMQSFRVRGAMRTNNGHQLLESARAGLGLAILPGFLAVDAIIAGELLPVLLPYSPRGGDISIVYRQSQRSSSKVDALLQFLAENIGNPPVWDIRLAAFLQERNRS